MSTIVSNGGGATHIAKVTGQLSSLSNNLSDILMVSGGGGGGLLSGETDYSGKEAGGISGSGDNSANQSTGYAFGQGESVDGISGGGSGLYGGYKGTSSKSGGAGSGYIGNTLVSNKKMVGYNVPTSSAESTKTESVNEASESPVSGKPKIGNGFARIKLVREVTEETIFNIVASRGTTDLITGTEPTILTGSALPSYDSNEDALTVSNATAILYTNIAYKEFTRRAKRIEFNAVAKIKSYSSSYQGTTSFFVRIGSIFFIFSRELSKVLIHSDSSTFTHYAEPAILNDLTLNTFYNVKAVFHLNGSYKITKMQTYVNGTLTWENTFSTPLDLYNGDLPHVWVHIADGDCYLRSADVKIYMNEGA